MTTPLEMKSSNFTTNPTNSTLELWVHMRYYVFTQMVPLPSDYHPLWLNGFPFEGSNPTDGKEVFILLVKVPSLNSRRQLFSKEYILERQNVVSYIVGLEA